jgi:hypothetical protein
MIKITIFFVSFFIISSCSYENLKSRTVEEYYIPTGVDKYFLSDIPAWANFDQFAGCFRNAHIRYVNVEALMKSFTLTFNQALQLQGLFNEDFISLKNINKLQTPTIKQEESIFFNSSEKVTSKIFFFVPPTFQRVNLVFLDEVLGNELKEKKIKTWLSSAAMETGVPVLVSFCLTKPEVEKKFPEMNYKMITAEMFSIYNMQGKMTPGFKLDLTQLFMPDQRLYFYSQKKMIPEDAIKGTYKILNY